MIQGHGGNIFAVAAQLGCQPQDILDMSSNINPLGPVPGLLEHLRTSLDMLCVLPDVDGQRAARALAHLLDIDEATVLPGAGTTQFIYAACQALASRTVLILGPTYADYQDACRMQGIEPDLLLATAENSFSHDFNLFDDILSRYDTVFLCNPNNPTGWLIAHNQLRELCHNHPAIRFIIDESYLPFVAGEKSMGADLPENVAVLWSASKIFGIPGLRAGFLLARPKILLSFQNLRQPWSMNSLAQEAISYLGQQKDAVQAFLARTHQHIQHEKQEFCQILQAAGLTLYPSASSYILMKLLPGQNAATVSACLQEKRILIRNCSNFSGLDDQYIRVALKDTASNQRVAHELLACLKKR